MKQFFYLRLWVMLPFLFNPLFSQETEVFIPEWLVAGPLPVMTPLFQNRSDEQKSSTDRSLLETNWLDFERLQPVEGLPLTGQSTKILWNRQTTENSGFLKLDTIPAGYARYVLAVYIETKQWMRLKLVLNSRHLFQVYFDQQLIASKTVADDSSKKDAGKAEAEVKCETGKHLLVIHMLCSPKPEIERSFRGIVYSKKEKTEAFCLTTDPKEPVALKHILDIPRITNVQLSPDGAWALMGLVKAKGDQNESWYEIRRTEDASLIHSTQGITGWVQAQWGPKGKRLAYMTQSGKETTIWIRDFDQNQLKAVLRNIKNVTRYLWSPDGQALYYEITEKSDPVKTGLKKTDGLRNRQPGMTDRTSVYRYDIEKEYSERLTDGLPSLNLHSISPKGDQLLLIRQKENLERRPYVETSLFMLDLKNGRADSLWTFGWFGEAVWSPDGTQLLITGGPSLFGSIGVRLSGKNIIPNDYDNQAYLLDLQTKKPKCITLDFNPSVDDVIWNAYDGFVYMITTDRSNRTVYRYDPVQGSFELLELGIDAVSGFSPARNAAMSVYYGSGAGNPPKVFLYDLKNNSNRFFFHPAEEEFRYTRFGTVKPWTFRNKQKVVIDGYVHYPPDFDSTKLYPCIVYYYGGTTPVTRDFGGRYPKEWYAANGYIVYTLQPGGAKGYGQEFSAIHVNNWGITVADEIIDGVQQFLKAHPFVDKKRVACIGASYGGFMTMLLLTKTTMFAAAISHAGISSISSYWGEGYWGYSYSAMATANSFPWNRKDIYVNQSPLFSADKIRTPLLLLHGTSDNNVPVGESIQLYTALKLLNRPVELIQVEDQDHHIVQYSKRKLWTKTIMAWFDRWLKNQPEWWEDLYGKKE